MGKGEIKMEHIVYEIIRVCFSLFISIMIYKKSKSKFKEVITYENKFEQPKNS